MDYGLLVLGLGYAIFLTNANIQLTATGVGKWDSYIAAAIGVSLCIVGGGMGLHLATFRGLGSKDLLRFHGYDRCQRVAD
jgi:hypothetical protein